MRKIAVLHSGNSHQYRTFHEPKYNRYFCNVIYLPELEQTSLAEIDVLIVPSQLHRGLVSKHIDQIRSVVERGKTIVAFGAQSCDWFPNHNWQFRPTNFWWWLEPNADSGLVLNQPDHDLFRYITLDDATWHYHGVFFPPAGTETLISVKEDGAVLYIDKVSTPGTLIMTTLDPEYHFGSYFMPATERFLDGFLPWLAAGRF